MSPGKKLGKSLEQQDALKRKSQLEGKGKGTKMVRVFNITFQKDRKEGTFGILPQRVLKREEKALGKKSRSVDLKVGGELWIW